MVFICGRPSAANENDRARLHQRLSFTACQARHLIKNKKTVMVAVLEVGLATSFFVLKTAAPRVPMETIFKGIVPSVLALWEKRLLPPAGQTPSSPNRGVEICSYSNVIHRDNVMKAVKLRGWIGDDIDVWGPMQRPGYYCRLLLSLNTVPLTDGKDSGKKPH